MLLIETYRLRMRFDRKWRRRRRQRPAEVVAQIQDEIDFRLLSHRIDGSTGRQRTILFPLKSWQARPERC